MPSTRAIVRRVSHRSSVSALLALVLAACAAPVTPPDQPHPPSAPVTALGVPEPVVAPSADRPTPKPDAAAVRLVEAVVMIAPLDGEPPAEAALPGLQAVPPPARQPIARGMASWYGPRFHGRRTANGERYDMHALTAAHKTLPFGTRLRVRSVHTGQEVVVRINDRGPYKHQRIIDLSRAAMVALGTIERGVTEVELLRE